jgi:AraC-like DNA-binding protein
MPSAAYREFTPCPVLQAHVRAFFTYSIPAAPAGVRLPQREIEFREVERQTTPLFADAGITISVCYGPAYRVDRLWEPGGPAGHVIGAMSGVRQASHGGTVIQVGAYLRPGTARDLIPVPARELTDRIVGIDEVWGHSPEARIAEAHDDSGRVSILEADLLCRLNVEQRSRVRVSALAALAAAHGGRLSVEQLAHGAGISRQHLTKLFREEVGVGPKLYCRLARFRAALARLNSPAGWAETAAELGYADQSHLIADFKHFSGLTPAAMTGEHPFHPFAA